MAINLKHFPMHDFFFLRLGKNFHQKISYSDIIYAEAVKKYVRIVTTKKTHLVLSSMCLVEKTLPQSYFCRIHRSYIISLFHLTAFDNEAAYIGDKIFPIGKQHKGILQQKLTILSADGKDDLDENTSMAETIIRSISG
jgi:hypothetical protein